MIQETTPESLNTKTLDEIDDSISPETFTFPPKAESMIVSYNYQLTEAHHIDLPLNDRAFCYGDGLFETIMFREGKIRFFKDHMKRLKNGMKALGFEGVGGVKKTIIKHQLKRLIKKNRIEGDARFKIQVWRKNGGLYFPQNLHFNIMMSAVPCGYPSSPPRPLKVSFSDSVRLQFSSFSKYKTLNSLPYIVASLEKSKKQVDDLILLSGKGHIAECTSSNIFWVKSGKAFTPRLKTGCVEGVARKNVIKILEKNGVKVNKVKARKEVLMKADHVFMSNVNHIQQIHQIDDKSFDPYPIIEKMW